MDYYIVICFVNSSIRSVAHSSVGTSFSQLVLHLCIMNTGAMTLKMPIVKSHFLVTCIGYAFLTSQFFAFVFIFEIVHNVLI